MRERIAPPPNRAAAMAAETNALERQQREAWRQRDFALRQFCIEQAVKAGSSDASAPAFILNPNATSPDGAGGIKVDRVVNMEFATMAMARAMYQFLTVPIKDILADET